jgi:hypothetical protein
MTWRRRGTGTPRCWVSTRTFQRPDADNPAYVEFRVGDYQDELGLIDRRYAPAGTPTGTGGVGHRVGGRPVREHHRADVHPHYLKVLGKTGGVEAKVS